jgi:beta-aspartyl-dipeptidase (metallo-type)
VVGVLGADTTTRHLTAILGRVRQLAAGGLSAFMYTGGYPVPPPTITGSVRDDLVLIPEVIGVGELAVSDQRSTEPQVTELARLAGEAQVGGAIGGKAGVVHFHVGGGQRRLACLRALLDEHEVEPRHLYPTHLNRSEALLEEGVELARRGCFVDLDIVQDGLGAWVRRYLERGGPPDRLTVSSDTGTPGAAPGRLRGGLAACVQQHALALETVLPLATRNTAAALRLGAKGQVAPGRDADLLVVEPGSLEPVHVVARGRTLLRGGRPVGALDRGTEGNET